MPFPTYEKKEQIPAGAEDVYEEKEGKWLPKLPDVSTLEGTLVKVRGEKKTAEDERKKVTEERDAAVRERDALKAQVGDPEGKSKALLDQWKRERDEAVAAKDVEIGKLNAELRTIRLDDKAKAEFIKAGGRPERADAALALTRPSLDLGESGELVVKDEKGNVTTTPVGDFYGKTFKGSMPELYKGTQASGGGAAGAKVGSGTGGALTADDVLKNPGLAFDAANAETVKP